MNVSSSKHNLGIEIFHEIDGDLYLAIGVVRSNVKDRSEPWLMPIKPLLEIKRLSIASNLVPPVRFIDFWMYPRKVPQSRTMQRLSGS
jgi:hypothetical protein